MSNRGIVLLSMLVVCVAFWWGMSYPIASVVKFIFSII